jgi:hypothetical protein
LFGFVVVFLLKFFVALGFLSWDSFLDWVINGS